MCDVLRCQEPSVADLSLSSDGAPRMVARLCTEHDEMITAGEPWRLDADSRKILVGRDVAASGVLVASDFTGWRRGDQTHAYGGTTAWAAVFVGEDGSEFRVMMSPEIRSQLVAWAEGLPDE